MVTRVEGESASSNFVFFTTFGFLSLDAGTLISFLMSDVFFDCLVLLLLLIMFDYILRSAWLGQPCVISCCARTASIWCVFCAT